MHATADLFDEHGETLGICDADLRSYGGRAAFEGIAATIRCYEDNSKVREAVAEPGHGRVLVVDGGGSRRKALLGDRLAQRAVDNGWAGLVIYGAVRDAAILATMPLGVVALCTTPRKTVKRGDGDRDVPVALPGLLIHPGVTVVVDPDGVVVIPAATHRTSE